MNRVQLSAEYFPNPVASKALSNANIYVGIPDTDPEVVANRKTVSALQENGSIVAITQPVKTGLGGIPVYNGSPVTLLVDGQYSVKVTSSTGTQLYYVPVNYKSDGSPVVKYVSDIASLRTTQPETGDGETIYLVCRTSLGDGGHGTFYWDATSTDADDGQDTIAVAGVSVGRWKRNIDPITDELSTHINLTAAHGATDAPTPGRIVQRDVNGCSSFAPGTDPSHAVIVSQLAAAVLSQIMSSFDGDFSNPNAGWIKFPNGLMVQWGVYLSGNNAAVTHSWPVEFPDGCFAAVGQIRNQDPSHESTITIKNAGSKTFGLNGYARQYSCFVIGIGYDAPYADILFWDGFDGSISGNTYTSSSSDYPSAHTGTLEGSNGNTDYEYIEMDTVKKAVGSSSMAFPDLYVTAIKFALVDKPTNHAGRFGFWHNISSNYTWSGALLAALRESDNFYSTRIIVQGADSSVLKRMVYVRYYFGNTLYLSRTVTLTDTTVKDLWVFLEVSWSQSQMNVYMNGVLKDTVNYNFGASAKTSLGQFAFGGSGIDRNVDNLIISNDPNRDLYALALLEACPRV